MDKLMPTTAANTPPKPSSKEVRSGRILIGVCTLNEAANIEPMVKSLREAVPHADVLIVDDNSPDGTADIVRGLGKEDTKIRVDVRTERGLGGAIRHAMVAAIDGGYDWFINLDGDFSHDPADLPRMMAAANEADVVIGSRYVTGGAIVGWPLRRKLMSRMVNRFATLCLRLPVKDCSGSMRCYRVAKLQEVEAETLVSQGYSVLEEILIRLNEANASMVEVPITFTDRTRGESKLTTREALRSMGQMMKLALKR